MTVLNKYDKIEGNRSDLYGQEKLNVLGNFNAQPFDMLNLNKHLNVKTLFEEWIISKWCTVLLSSVKHISFKCY